MTDRLWPAPSDEPATPLQVDLERWLVGMLGPEAVFRPGQREAIEAVLKPNARALVVQKTGWGKSVVYWLATRVLRDQGAGPTLIISPLLALMRNQIATARRIGLRAMTIHSGNREEWEEVQEALSRNEVDVLLISPERLANDQFRVEVLPSMQGSIGLFVVDEVHCISDWGHDFRPDYRRIKSILDKLPKSVRVLGTTATANQRVVDDMVEQLGSTTEVIRGPLRRESLQLGAFVLRDQADRLAWLAKWIPWFPGTGIVYCLTVNDTERVAEWLRGRGIDARAYYGGLDQDQRIALEDGLIRNEFKVLVATVALGMGFDKPDLGFVVHYQRPGSVIAYYQQVGRAGRALTDAYGVLLSGREDDDIQEFFINSAFPPADQMRAVLAVLDRVDSANRSLLQTQVNLPAGRIDAILKILEVEGAVIRVPGWRYQRTLTRWQPDEERVAMVTARRYQELDQMRAYMEHRGCLMQFLAQALDDPNAAPCGRCVTEAPVATVMTNVDEALVRDAATFLRGSFRTIEPRKKWPTGAIPHLNGWIDPKNEPGMALAIYEDAGWGKDVARGKYHDGRFSDEVVAAAATLIAAHWSPRSNDGWWVTAIPSHRHPGLVSDAAERLAKALDLPYRGDVLAILNATPPQKQMANSAQQLRNIHAGLRAQGAPLAGPVILVDDIVDSRWTLTVGGHLLRTHGSGPVYPFAFAQASTRVDG